MSPYIMMSHTSESLQLPSALLLSLKRMALADETSLLDLSNTHLSISAFDFYQKESLTVFSVYLPGL